MRVETLIVSAVFSVVVVSEGSGLNASKGITFPLNSIKTQSRIFSKKDTFLYPTLIV